MIPAVSCTDPVMHCIVICGGSFDSVRLTDRLIITSSQCHTAVVPRVSPIGPLFNTAELKVCFKPGVWDLNEEDTDINGRSVEVLLLSSNAL